MSTTTIPTQIIDFNIYNAPNKLIGAGDEVTLPKIVSKTYTAALAGGDIDLPGLTIEDSDAGIEAAKAGGMYAIAMGVAENNSKADISVSSIGSLYKIITMFGR